MKDLDFCDNLFRKQHKKYFPFLRKTHIEELIKNKTAFISKDKQYCEMFRIYKRKSKISPKLTAYPGDINLWIGAVNSSNTSKGIATKYRKIMLQKLYKEKRTFFSIIKEDNYRSIKFVKKCGFVFSDKYEKNGHRYVVYTFKIKSKRFSEWIK